MYIAWIVPKFDQKVHMNVKRLFCDTHYQYRPVSKEQSLIYEEQGGLQTREFPWYDKLESNEQHNTNVRLILSIALAAKLGPNAHDIFSIIGLTIEVLMTLPEGCE